MAIETKPREANEVETEQLATGCEAIAEAIRLADVDVMAAYPIRPYDGVMQAAAKLIASGKMDVEYIVADGEHSQFEIVKHACAVGSRVFVGSSGVGWFYAFEAIAVTAGLRLPVVAICGNRALDDPGAFGTEHNDSLAVRDLGWLLPWAETAQEALDLALMAWRVGEDKRVSLPVAIGLDGAFLTHSQQIVKIPTQAAVDKFLPPFDLGDRLLHPDNPITIAPQVDQDWLMEIVRSLSRCKAIGVIDRDYSVGSPHYGGVLYNEVRSALYSQPKRPVVVGFIAGLGGREIEQPMAQEIFEKTKAAASGDLKAGDTCHWIGVRS